MKLKDKAVVLRETKVGESSRLLTLFTCEHGVVTGQARGSLNPKSKLFSASGQFSYSEFVMREGRKYYWIDEATPIELFFGLRNQLEALSLASYLTELVEILSPHGREAEPVMQLLLRSMYLLAEDKRPAPLVKAVFELRALADSGFMPDLLACEDCGAYDGEGFLFDTRLGTLLCAGCAAQKGLHGNLTAGALSALRHIVLSPGEKIFSFTVGGDSLDALYRIAEQYLLFHLERPPRSLAFLKTVL